MRMVAIGFALFVGIAIAAEGVAANEGPVMYAGAKKKGRSVPPQCSTGPLMPCMSCCGAGANKTCSWQCRYK
jgi:hypothetical protein